MDQSWFPVRRDVFSYELGAKELAVYMYLAYLCHRNGYAIVRHNIIGERCGLSVASVKRAIANLQDKKLVMVTNRKYGANEYRLFGPQLPTLIAEDSNTKYQKTEDNHIVNKKREKIEELLQELGEL